MVVLSITGAIPGAIPGAAAPARATPAGAGQPDLGPNVVIFDPTKPLDQIQASVDAIAAQQVDSE
ncbi:MAG TPA: hypothetical protein VFT22_13865, partial [Kofleriaceae bacterium]|nr:hypothetical protein [Kofleriaceae bacterium]